MVKRDTGDLDEELQSPDRYELDDAVFEILGEHSTERRKDWVARLHSELEAFHRAMKEKEVLAMRNRAITARGSKLSPEQMATELWNDLDPSLVRRFPDGFFGNPEPVPEIELPEGNCKLLSSPLTGQAGIEIDGTHIELGDERRAELAKAVFDSGRRGTVPIPRDPDLCARILMQYRAYLDQMTAEFHHLVSQKTADEKMQAKVVELLKRKLV